MVGVKKGRNLPPANRLPPNYTRFYFAPVRRANISWWVIRWVGCLCNTLLKPMQKNIAGIVLVDSVHKDQSNRMNENARDNYEGNLKALTTFSSLVAPLGLLRITNQPENHHCR